MAKKTLFPLWSLKKWSGKFTQTTGTYEKFKKQTLKGNVDITIIVLIVKRAIKIKIKIAIIMIRNNVE